MAEKKRTILKTYFETGKVPSQQQYGDLIDSKLSILDHNTGSIIISGTIETTGSINTLGQAKIGSTTGTVNASFINRELTFDEENVALSQTTAGVTALNAAPDKDIHFNVSGSTKMFLSSSGNLGIGTITPESTLTVEGDISASGNILTEGKIQVKGSDVTLEGGHISMSGDILMTGSISASGAIFGEAFYMYDIQALKYHVSTDTITYGVNTKVNTFQGPISASNISSSGIISASSIHLSKINLEKGSPGGGPYGGTINVGSGRAFEFQMHSIPSIPCKAAGAKTSKSDPAFVKATDCNPTDVIVINCYTDMLSVDVMGQSSSQAISTPGFWVTIGNEADADFDVGSASFSVVLL